jgi:hypothetical protein
MARLRVQNVSRPSASCVVDNGNTDKSAALCHRSLKYGAFRQLGRFDGAGGQPLRWRTAGLPVQGSPTAVKTCVEADRGTH